MRAWFKKRAEARQAELAAAQERAEEERRRARAARDRERQARLNRNQIRKNVLAIVDSGNVPRISFRLEQGTLPFKFQKSEHVLWIFPDVEYLEQKTRREIVGRSAGTSVRVMKGVSVRVGASRGRPEEHDEIVRRGVGLLAVTTKHIYFKGDMRSMRIPFSKIVSTAPFADGVEVTRDRASGHPEFFIVGEEDAWFANDLIHAVPSFEAAPSMEVLPAEEYHLLHQDDASGLEDTDY